MDVALVPSAAWNPQDAGLLQARQQLRRGTRLTTRIAVWARRGLRANWPCTPVRSRLRIQPATFCGHEAETHRPD